MSARKNDSGKPPIDLVPPELIIEAARAYGVGARLYGRNNYQKGLSFSRVYAAALRHLLAWWGGEDVDVSGVSHLGHAAASLGMLLWLAAHCPNCDDRSKPKKGG